MGKKDQSRGGTTVKTYRLSGRVKESETPIKGKIDVNWLLCTGCRLCEHACSVKHEGHILHDTSRIRVLQLDPGPLDIPVLCHQCWDFPCIEACPVKPKVLSLEEVNGNLHVDIERCLGEKCGLCAKACHHESAIWFHPKNRKAMVCDLCGGEPECSRICPTGCLSFLPGASFDGVHYAKSPEVIADSLAKRFLPAKRMV
jgi:Fe-S-cluster-containing hydrogenase component 2